MSRAVALSLLCSSLAFCAPRAGVDSTPAPGRSFELRLDQPTQAGGLSLTWTSIADSRCPEGVTCIWAGAVKVTIDARDGGDASQLELTLGPRQGGDTASTAHHEIRLSEVSPHPRAGTEIPRSAQRATVIVTPR